MRLTKDQQRAVDAPGSVAVTAGAGTGKTMMLTERYLFHVHQTGLSPLEIVAVTFTEKAADELRSRIRREISSVTRKGSVLAEVDAGQISTIHALAARICRDFYDLAGIPPDFQVLDETESLLFLSGKFGEAMATIEPEIIDKSGYTWLSLALQELLNDPLTSEKALQIGPEQWDTAVTNNRNERLSALTESEIWRDTGQIFSRYEGAESDLLEGVRCNAVRMMDLIENGITGPEVLDLLDSLKTNGGRKNNWPSGGIAEVKTCIKELKAALKDFPFQKANEDDEHVRLYERVKLLREAFTQVRNFLSEARLKEKFLDFNDLERYALKILKNPVAVEHYGQRWRAFLVDEFQDTNPVQAEIVERLTENAMLTIVGDEKQSIYGFRRADVEIFQRFYQSITTAGGTEVSLSLSFRSHQSLVTKTNQIFDKVLGELHQDLFAAREEAHDEGPHVSLHVVSQVKPKPGKSRQQIVEARHIAAQISEMVNDGMLIHDKVSGSAREIEYRDIAILSRTWAPLDIYLDALAAEGIPAVHAGGGSLLDTREAKDGYALLSFLADPSDDLSFVAVLRSPFFAVSDKTLLELALEKQHEQSWWEMIQDHTEDLTHISDVLSKLIQESSKNTPARLLRIADRLTGYSAVIGNLVHAVRREADWRGFLDLLKELESTGWDDVFGVSRYLRQLIEGEIEIPRPPLDTGQAVSLMTIHKAKGLEWPVVFVPDLARIRNRGGLSFTIDADLGVGFPLEDESGDRIEPAIYHFIKNRKKDREDEEAKRVLYVALTRARDKVVLTSTNDEGPDIGLLRSGLESAGIRDLEIEYSDELAIPPVPLPPDPRKIPPATQIKEISPGLTDIPVTALSLYDQCPKSFRFRFVEGHPGLGEGSPRARTIGILTHAALEHDLETKENLRPFEPIDNEEMLSEAISLADSFRTEECYADVKNTDTRKEVSFKRTILGVGLHGRVDLVGDDFVLDFKTDSGFNPAPHRFQLYLYSWALEKTKAYIAYLRHNRLYKFDESEIKQTEEDVLKVIRGIRDGQFSATPSQKVCGYCQYNKICADKFVTEDS